MGSSFKLKNAQDQEFSIVHNDNAGAITVASDKLVVKDANGNVGIGTGSPVAELHIKGTTTPTYSRLKLSNSTSGDGIADGFDAVLTGLDAYLINRENGGNLILSTNNAERMRIDTAGNVGIGVTPSAWNTITPIQIKNASLGGYSNYLYLNSNTFYDGVWKYIANDNAARYQQTSGKHEWYTAPSGTAGNTISWTNAMTLDTSGNLQLTSGTGALGYGTGAGGTVIQATSKSTAVTLNKPTGQIITSNSALAAGATTGFLLNNNLITSNDTVVAHIGGNGGGSAYDCWVHYCVNGTVNIAIKNIDGVSRSEALAINFTIIKGAIA